MPQHTVLEQARLVNLYQVYEVAPTFSLQPCAFCFCSCKSWAVNPLICCMSAAAAKSILSDSPAAKHARSLEGSVLLCLSCNLLTITMEFNH